MDVATAYGLHIIAQNATFGNLDSINLDEIGK